MRCRSHKPTSSRDAVALTAFTFEDVGDERDLILLCPQCGEQYTGDWHDCEQEDVQCPS